MEHWVNILLSEALLHWVAIAIRSPHGSHGTSMVTYDPWLLTRSAVIAHVQASESELLQCWMTFEIDQLVRLMFVPIGVPCGM